ncbi:type II toxin-antitoxin system RelE/ParE family toxin [Marivita hallyeonensis]|uniref:Plasmid stabilization system protein ParE n=1 Tax=Marivita hallyeonensis TaxID=996342 RepID=A0A1M5Y1Q1_9RHOB|nr:type II toxin-antitoxin system RelE/ParE family toxin [Marivita hallyeonensis]SHI05869.1 Plasmid stabilization system protein ParE [Marivita hallyeonensis]
MGYRVLRSTAARDDLEAIFDFLVDAYVALGTEIGDALDQAETRLLGIEDDIDALGDTPHQGTLWPEVMDGLRWTTKNRAILYFTVDDTSETVFLLAVFFGGQDHKTHILERIRSD